MFSSVKILSTFHWFRKLELTLELNSAGRGFRQWVELGRCVMDRLNSRWPLPGQCRGNSSAVQERLTAIGRLGLKILLAHVGFPCKINHIYTWLARQSCKMWRNKIPKLNFEISKNEKSNFGLDSKDVYFNGIWTAFLRDTIHLTPGYRVVSEGMSETIT